MQNMDEKTLSGFLTLLKFKHLGTFVPALTMVRGMLNSMKFKYLNFLIYISNGDSVY
jgi:hypothetical protein